RGRHDREQLGESWADAGTEHRRATAPARRLDPVAIGAEVVAGEERGVGDDVHAGAEDAFQLGDVVPHRVVDDAVRGEGEQRVDVVGGGDGQRRDPAQLAGLTTD